MDIATRADVGSRASVPVLLGRLVHECPYFIQYIHPNFLFYFVYFCVSSWNRLFL